MTDAHTRQVDMGTRWYAPGQGRFTTRDIVAGDPLHPITFNQWVYGNLNPVSMHDPTGMKAVAQTGGCGSLGKSACDDAVDSFIA